jgi:hypothetical protein
METMYYIIQYIIFPTAYFAVYKTYVWGSGSIAPPLLTSILDGEWLASRPGLLTTGTHCIGRWMGTGTHLDAVENRKIRCPYSELNPGRQNSRYTA